jgi:hypothetical protein
MAAYSREPDADRAAAPVGLKVGGRGEAICGWHTSRAPSIDAVNEVDDFRAAESRMVQQQLS